MAATPDDLELPLDYEGWFVRIVTKKQKKKKKKREAAAAAAAAIRDAKNGGSRTGEGRSAAEGDAEEASSSGAELETLEGLVYAVDHRAK